MAGILETVNNMNAAPAGDITLEGNPMLEGEIVLAALMES